MEFYTYVKVLWVDVSFLSYKRKERSCTLLHNEREKFKVIIQVIRNFQR